MKTIIKATAKKTLNTATRRTVAEACAPKKRGRPSNSEIAAREAKAAKAAERAKAKEKAAKADSKSPKKQTANVFAGDFTIKAFKKAISLANKKPNDMDIAADVRAMYKDNRKQLKDALPKHAVNAFEKSLGAKKDEKLLQKAMVAAEKHIVEKDFTM